MSLYEKTFPELGRSLGEELLQPTHIYTQEVLPLLEAKQDIDVKALAHITGDGFLNLSRVPSHVTFVIDTFPSPPPIFSILQQLGGIADPEMFEVFNMGIGFCVVVPKNTKRWVCLVFFGTTTQKPIPMLNTSNISGSAIPPSC